MEPLMCGGWTIFGQVLDVIQFDESIERALLYALGPTLVCDTHKEAKKLLIHLLCP
jgi:chromosome segregation ATPase